VALGAGAFAALAAGVGVVGLAPAQALTATNRKAAQARKPPARFIGGSSARCARLSSVLSSAAASRRAVGGGRAPKNSLVRCNPRSFAATYTFVALIPDAWLPAPALARGEGERPASPRDARDDARDGGRALAAGKADLEVIYAEHSRAIHRFLCDMLGDRAEAADATQETFVRVFQRLSALRNADRPVAWLFGVARHVSLEFRRARRRKRRIIDDEPASDTHKGEGACSPRSPEDAVLGHEAICVVDGALARLSDDRRAVLLLRIDHDLAYEDIAELMGWTVAKVKVEIHRARQVLREELRTYEGGSR
jgi:RNA polymerase sigma-70 factor (ECF subfamily)